MAATYRPKGNKVEENFDYLKEKLKRLTNLEKYGDNSTLNMAINLAAERMREIESEKKELNQEKLRAIEFER